jgi:hypothetical protein
MKEQITTLEPAKGKRRILLFGVLLLGGLILITAGIVLGNCFDAYQTASTL